MKHPRKAVFLGLAVLVGLAAAAAPALADVYMKQKVHTGAFQMMGQSQPEKDEIMVFWMAPNKARTDSESGAASMLFLTDKKVLYMIDHAKKTYAEMPLDFDKMLGQAADQAGGGEEQAQQMAGMMKGMFGNMSAKVTETAETKKIGNWNCRKYLIDIDMGMGKTQSEAWTTEDLKVDTSMAFTMANAMMAAMPGFDKIIAEMKKLKGVVVYQTSKVNMMGAEVVSTTELLECTEKPAPAGTYDLPAGYKKVQGFGN